MLRFGLLFNLSLFVVCMVAGTLLWLGATAAGGIDSTNEFLSDLLGVRLVGSALLKVSVFGGLVFAVLGTGACVLGAVLYNLISDVVGGVEVHVLEDEARRTVV